uniref:Uncharacterized protein n=1 Tax=Physcomitrium patens TaxID=3218 RepID=A0A7I4E4B6_PHYPA
MELFAIPRSIFPKRCEALSLICDGMGRPACTCAFADSDKII